MKSRAKSFVLNRCRDWQLNGLAENVCFLDDAMVSDQNSAENGVYFSSSFDSLEKANKWHRLKIDANIPQNAVLKVRVYASDKRVANIIDPETGREDKEISLDEYLTDRDIPAQSKIELLDYIGAKTYTNISDILLVDFVGEFIWISFELENYNDPIRIDRVQIEFPMINFIKYLPAIYSTSDESKFMSRYIGVFQSIYLDLDEKINTLPTIFNTNTENYEFLQWLTSWFSIGDVFIWGEERLRNVLKNAVSLYKIKGTKESIKAITKLYTGATPRIIEYFNLEDTDCFNNDRGCMENLYGKSKHVFTVILSGNDIPKSENYVELLRLINKFKPIDSVCNLVVLSDNIYLGHHCYLGINSYISRRQRLAIGPDESMTNSMYL